MMAQKRAGWCGGRREPCLLREATGSSGGNRLGGWNKERKNSRKICLPACSSRNKSLELLSDWWLLQTASGSELTRTSRLLGLTPPCRSSGTCEGYVFMMGLPPADFVNVY